MNPRTPQVVHMRQSLGGSAVYIDGMVRTLLLATT